MSENLNIIEEIKYYRFYKLITFHVKSDEGSSSASFNDSVLAGPRGCNHSLTFPTFAVYPLAHLPTYLPTAEPLKNIVKAALKYCTVSHRKNCCAVDGNLPLSPRTSDDSYCSHEGNTSAVTLNSRAGGIPSRDIAATPYCRCISEHRINQPC